MFDSTLQHFLICYVLKLTNCLQNIVFHYFIRILYLLGEKYPEHLEFSFRFCQPCAVSEIMVQCLNFTSFCYLIFSDSICMFLLFLYFSLFSDFNFVFLLIYDIQRGVSFFQTVFRVVAPFRTVYTGVALFRTVYKGVALIWTVAGGVAL